MPNDDQTNPLIDDLLWGTKSIAAFIGKSLTETQYLVGKNKIPVGRLGPKTVFASKKQLTSHFSSATQLTSKKEKAA
jgi:hypothetical protein